MTTRPPAWSRRRFLRGAGALVALPLLESLREPGWAADPPTAGGMARLGTPPLRQLIVTVAGGTVLESWKPQAVGPLGKLPSILRPLERHKADLLVLSGLSQNGRQEGGGNAHTNCAGLHLTGAEVYRWDGKVPRSTVSVDQLAAKAVAGETPLPSLELGAPNGEQLFSWSEAGAVVPYEDNPKHAFDRLFKGRAPVVPTWKAGGTRNTARTASRPGAAAASSDDRLVLDQVLDEAKAVRGSLCRSDQVRLDEYLETVHALERRITLLDQRVAAEAVDAGAAARRASSLVLPSDEVGWRVDWNGDDTEQRAEYFRLMTTLAVLALQTDSTRVATLAFGNDGEHWDGVVTVTSEFHHHTLEHQGNADPVERADPLSREACRQIHEWYSPLFAEVLDKMKGIDEAGTSLLDNSMVLYTSYMANGGHGTKDYPILLAGRARGTVKTGRHAACKPDTPVANLYLSMLERMGAKHERFGESTGRLGDLS